MSRPRVRVCGIKINTTEAKYAFCIFECIKISAMSDILFSSLLQREKKIQTQQCGRRSLWGFPLTSFTHCLFLFICDADDADRFFCFLFFLNKTPDVQTYYYISHQNRQKKQQFNYLADGGKKTKKHDHINKNLSKHPRVMDRTKTCHSRNTTQLCLVE